MFILENGNPKFVDCVKPTQVILRMKEFCKKYDLRIIAINHYGPLNYRYLCMDFLVKNKY